MAKKKILIVDDDTYSRESIAAQLDEQYEIDQAENGESGLRKLEEQDFDVILSDIRMPGMSGLDFLERVTVLRPDTRVLMITAFGEIGNAVDAMRKGAYDYLVKGEVKGEELIVRIERALENQELRRENVRLKSELGERFNFGNMVGKTKVMEELFEMVESVAQSRSTVLINGESGTGKELVARAVHYNSPRADRPFIKLNCAALPQDLIESELFGHEKGAFTGAVKQTKGRFELADGGTLLLDEISEIEPPLQAKLLRVLQEREFERIGSGTTIKVDVRIVATTNRNLRDEIEKGNFREDLFYRLNVIPVQMPALRERKPDVMHLAEFFLERYNEENDKNISGFSEKAMEVLINYDWPGNVRELENYVERAVVICKEPQISESHLPLEILTGEPRTASSSSGIVVGTTVREMEKQLILKTLESCDGNRTNAADTLGISSRTLRNKLHEYGMSGIFKKGVTAGDNGIPEEIEEE
ncbi:MAG: two-component system response regulator [Gemmatimonadetes bacterium]|jgi:DNA-binding NtrC family response regulator|nr:two-component system response regulator [Gemmatimonadota bacterium]HCK09058.1 two-component system response regulator [Candidatus Latescibacterota bacterium]